MSIFHARYRRRWHARKAIRRMTLEERVALWQGIEAEAEELMKLFKPAEEEEKRTS